MCSLRVGLSRNTLSQYRQRRLGRGGEGGGNERGTEDDGLREGGMLHQYKRTCLISVGGDPETHSQTLE